MHLETANQAAKLNGRHLVSVAALQALRHREQLAFGEHVPRAIDVAWLPEEVRREAVLAEHEAWIAALRARWGL